MSKVQSKGGWAHSEGNPAPKSKAAAEELQTLSVTLAANPTNSDLAQKCTQLKTELKNLQNRELLDYEQKTHVNWLQHGNQSMAFFGRAVSKYPASPKLYNTNSGCGRPASLEFARDGIACGKSFHRAVHLNKSAITDNRSKYPISIDSRCRSKCVALSLSLRVGNQEHSLLF